MNPIEPIVRPFLREPIAPARVFEITRPALPEGADALLVWGKPEDREDKPKQPEDVDVRPISDDVIVDLQRITSFDDMTPAKLHIVTFQIGSGHFQRDFNFEELTPGSFDTYELIRKEEQRLYPAFMRFGVQGIQRTEQAAETQKQDEQDLLRDKREEGIAGIHFNLVLKHDTDGPYYDGLPGQ